MNKLVLPLDDLLAVSKIMPCYCDGHAQKTVQTMSNEDAVVESSNVLLLWVRIGRVPKTMNLEGYCSAVEIRTRVEKMDTIGQGKG